MYLKIIRRSLYNLRDSYLIYVFASSFAVAVLTLLATLVSDPALKSVHYWNGTLQSVMYFMVFVFAFFTFVYMAYVGGFFIQQQSRGFRTYKKFGMSRFAISVIGFGKTFIIQVIAWIIGMVVAIIMQKFIGMLLVYLMYVRINFHFYFSWDILWLMLRVGFYSTLFFSLLNGLRSFWIVRDKKRSRRFHLNWFMKSTLGLLGLVMILVAIGLMVSVFRTVTSNNMIDRALINSLVVIVLFFVGTYLVYLGFLPLVLDIIDRTKFFSYRGINLFSFKYLRKRLVANTSIIWFVTELSAFALGILLFCYSGYQLVYQNYRGQYPFPVSAISQNKSIIEKDFAKHKTNVKKRYHAEIKRTVANIFDSSEGKYQQRLISFMSYSDYQKMPQRTKKHNPKVHPGEFLELKNDYQSLTPGYRNTDHQIYIKGSRPINARRVGSFFPFGTGMFSGLLMVVPDNYYDKVQSEVSDTFYGWDIKGSDHLSKKTIKKMDKENDSYMIRVHVGSSLDDSYLTKENMVSITKKKNYEYLQTPYSRQAQTKSIMRKTTGLMLFLISIFSIALLIALGSLLMLKILLRDDKEWQQLKTLKKIGATNGELKQIVRRETTFLFAIPIVLALIQAFVAVGILNLSGNAPTLIPFLLISLAYILLYGMVGVLTFIMSWRGVRDKL